jgi:D-glycero-D-manno-heptose 1,7-bisphosphate phosphatase
VKGQGGGLQESPADASKASAAAKPGAVFLDRDGTLIEDVGYLGHVERVALYPWSIDAVRLMNRAGFRVFIVTNQAGVARGFLEEAAIDAVHRHIDGLLTAGGARIEAYYYCPHHPQGTVEAYRKTCECRKPGRGLIDRAVREFGIDLARSFVVGHRWLDIELAQVIGARAVLVRTGYGRTEEQQSRPEMVADAVADNLIGATSWIVRHSQAPTYRASNTE